MTEAKDLGGGNRWKFTESKSVNWTPVHRLICVICVICGFRFRISVQDAKKR